MVNVCISPIITSKNLKKAFGESTPVIDNLTFSIRKGDFVSIIGPNGCGKSTLMNILSGFSSPDHGSVAVNAKNIAYVGQNSDEMLLPWLTVEENIAFPEKLHQIDKVIINNLLVNFKLESSRKKFPGSLSGGMKQATLMIRALAHNSEVLLLDEPFKSLDFDISIRIQQSLLDIWTKYKPTVILISHDIEEAIFLSQKVMIFSDKPTKIKKIIDLKVETKDKNISFLSSDKFLVIKKDILNTFYEK
ncbi:MAG: hypothetical protein A3G52_01830 [Candidatus Taylorbacteria bacterium RIFCSPLOWO2_12_FULL_43_20]|uniref:ABC transporter domain-containing protein n=1 Tax=Candidatus Taylorbacteria bacterium RIFCSPLOWO2_12_FULL_43_20 TaxID=1802332 RepID=A0A1G2P169_9BACT|nr:MAG: hypothetical protein A3B98_00315 [Candidatus Taylorbacteria bacterium RIFCSPHIGHO2_02_FULL_43_55]OHA29952.1 MAG: hypothetical protein A3E92_03945 [Candidatus Taylorbacteria bacterium RIFCSPHIGHO2_12_FULL_42_34]OHA30583.1 MAG: hypothetical protein A3B09_01565 [Candidatus Taylorbacteria bacterium RIFCSPLOWO2_01_FULL_43_83]OHA38414.1 MAG: hypothetical protein A3H58_04370 [Candidatus Taylorbacteria bacterium RIFCSPLOWO2_02_FULL_43_22b]OHA42023.1 MAG: hypothetical protein A3G52_01830 [Candid